MPDLPALRGSEGQVCLGSRNRLFTLLHFCSPVQWCARIQVLTLRGHEPVHIGCRSLSVQESSDQFNVYEG